MRRTVVDGKKGSGRESGEGRVSAGTHGWVWPARNPRRGSSCGQTAQPPWRPSLPGRVASDCVGERPRGRREKTCGVCQTGAPSYISEPPRLRVSVWRIVWGEDKTRFFPDYSPVRFEQKGVVAQMVERPLCMRKVGGSMPSYSNSYFAFFLLTGSRSKRRSATPFAKNHTFPGFLSLFLAACFLASANQEPSSPNQNVVSHRSVENRGRYASPASNKRPSGKAATVAGGAPLRARPARRGLRSIRNSSSRHAFEHIARSDARP